MKAMVIIATALLIAGISLIAIAFIIFIKSGCRNVIKDLRTTKRMVTDNQITFSSDVYYKPQTLKSKESQILKEEKNPERKMFRTNERVAVDDTALLAERESELLINKTEDLTFKGTDILETDILISES